ncbi:hypothetical protein PV733_46945 [Streptomyces europaeiscabiei]|uniref:type I restriction enzyme subunit R domain-containing protein n=1 Tax=Streptomyces europaeiscabiei TaxID=146819 RepID=UPI0029BCE3F7|nr:hypothetical protein [Streptomyces europaeiscabiei]MDX3716289.1 hypothetical protein [Streptomyces europaeiscabiei]
MTGCARVTSCLKPIGALELDVGHQHVYAGSHVDSVLVDVSVAAGAAALSSENAAVEASQVLAEVGKHDRITAEVNIHVSDAKTEEAAMRPYRLSEVDDEDQKRRFLTPDDPLCFLVVTAKLMTGFDAPNEGVLYLDKPLKAHNLFQTITRPNRTWTSPAGFVKTTGVVVDYISLAEEVQRAVVDPTSEGPPARAAGSSPT